MKPFFIFLLFIVTNLTAQKMNIPPGAFCDPETGLCTPAPIAGQEVETSFRDDVEIIYVGDPMCSWCWGISPALNRLEKAAEANGIPYRIVLGGLRPGGGEEWTHKFKDFLKHHWEEVAERSGQPFGDALFELANFNYDTEPACRAVVAARKLDAAKEGRFFELIQHHFYVKNRDPKEVGFYEPICEELLLDFTAFTALFNSSEIVEETRQDFQLNRQWGVSGYPTVIFRKDEQFYAIARGYAEFDQMWDMVTELSKE